MRTAAEYREEAAGYVGQAEAASHSRRLRLLEMAQSCLRLADQADLLAGEHNANGQAQPAKYTGYKPRRTNQFYVARPTQF